MPVVHKQSSRSEQEYSVAIVGAGASGVLTAMQMLKAAKPADQLHVYLIDPSPDTGRGVAYRTPDQQHRLNVPAAKMSAWPDDPDHLLNWLAQRGTPVAPGEFIARSAYGEYLNDCLGTTATTSSGQLSQFQLEVMRVTQHEKGYSLHLADGSSIFAKTVVLALGAPTSPGYWAPAELRESPRFVPDPWRLSADQRFESARKVLLVGSGLTMVDVALTLGPTHTVQVVSRSGLRPHAHRAQPSAPVSPPELPAGELSLGELRRSVSEHIDKTQAECGDWRPAIDSLRPLTNTLWAQLSLADRQEFLNKDLRQWNVLRHRMAPNSAAALTALMESGAVQMRIGEIAAARDLGDCLEIRFTDERRLRVDLVVDCTGPAPLSAHSGTGVELLKQMMRDGIVRPNNLNLGLDVNDLGEVITDDGSAAAGLVVVGPLRLGSTWETTAIPEIRVQAQQVAAQLLSRHRGNASNKP